MFFLLDVISGIVIAHIVGFFYGFEPTATHLFIGIACALLPDLDFLYHYVKTRETSAYKAHPYDHREGLHYPLLFIPIGSVLFFAIFGPVYATFFCLGALSHFLHDSVGIGWGIKWLYPLVKKNYKFFCDKNGSPSSQLVVSWSPHELTNKIVEHGDPQWIKNLFWRPLQRGTLTPLLVVEFLIPLIVIVGYIFWHFW